MSVRRYFLDEGVGESRAGVILDGRPERLAIVRDADPAIQALGARVVARVGAVDRNLGFAFLDMGSGPDAVLEIKPEFGPLGEGIFAEIEIRAEARLGKGARARWLGPAVGPARLVAPGPDLAARVAAWARGAPIVTGADARMLADAAQDEALRTVFALPGGGDIAIETTRALVAVDVDVGARSGGGSKRVTRAANLAAIGEAARLLRLKGLAGLVVIDLAGRGHDGAAIAAASRSAFAADNPGVAIGPVSRFGTMELAIPRRARGALEILTGGRPDLTAESHAMALVRAIEREAPADPGGRIEARAEPSVAAAAAPHMAALTARFGARLDLTAQVGQAGFEIRSR